MLADVRVAEAGPIANPVADVMVDVVDHIHVVREQACMDKGGVPNRDDSSAMRKEAQGERASRL